MVRFICHSCLRVRRVIQALALVGVAALPSVAFATPSTTYWAPSTASCQAKYTPHITYDTYFGKGTPPPGAGAPTYPVDTGLTMGILPSSKVQAEVGYDLLLPSSNPTYFFLNAKICTPESSMFKGSPAVSFGIYNVGFKKGVTDYNPVHVMFQKAFPGGSGYVAAGFYHGMSDTLFTNSDGKIVKNGAMIGVFSPDIPVGLKGLKKLNLTGDIQTGKNDTLAAVASVSIYTSPIRSICLSARFGTPTASYNRVARNTSGRRKSILISRWESNLIVGSAMARGIVNGSKRSCAITFGLLSLLTVFAGVRAASQDDPARSSATAPSNSGVDGDAIDRGADPCNDFYQFACGGWMLRHPIPADLAGIGRGREMRERSFALLTRIIATPGRNRERQKASDYFAACVNEQAIEARGVTPLAPVLARIAAANDRSELPALLAYLHSVAFQPDIPNRQSNYYAFFTLSPEHAVPFQMASVNPGGIALPDRNLYFSKADAAVFLRARYKDEVQQTLEMLGSSPADALDGAAKVLAIETALASASPDVAWQRAHKKYIIPIAELQAMTPHFDWSAYFNAASVPTISSIDVPMPEFMSVFDAIVSDVPFADIKQYLRWQVAHASVFMLPSRFRQADFDVFRRILRGQERPESRAELCIAETDDRLGDILGKAFVTEAFPPDAKKGVLTMIYAIKAAMAEDIDSASWMSSQTKDAAKSKLRAIVERIGYPNKWRDYSAVQIKKDDALGNFQRVLSFNRQNDVIRIGRPVDPDEWPAVTPTRGEAGYRFERNDVIFPAGFLQPPFFSPSRDAAVNYGAIGAVIGHEITHAFDNEGRNFDNEGSTQEWWSARDAEAFASRTSCLVNQYSQYVVDGGTRVNGRLTLSENIADNGGIRLALMAYLASPVAGSTTVDGFTSIQRVFLGWAQSWCVNIRPEAERLQAVTDPHSPNRYRVNGPLSNMPEFQAAFSCRSAAPMVRGAACRIW